jgi:selenophosphate synthetase-related protein
LDVDEEDELGILASWIAVLSSSFIAEVPKEDTADCFSIFVDVGCCASPPGITNREPHLQQKEASDTARVPHLEQKICEASIVILIKQRLVTLLSGQ